MKRNQGKGAIAVWVVVCLLFFSVAGAGQISRVNLNHATLSQLDSLRESVR
jgi:hypothetical protein